MKHIVIDLEMNHISKNKKTRKKCGMETIEIGAVMLDDDLQEISSFRTYVKPEYNDTISRKITDLTGITYDMVSDAPEFNEALKMFTKWCLGIGEDVTIYAWSNTDYTQIIKEVDLKRYNISAAEETLFSSEWLDFQDEFESCLGFEKKVSLKMAIDMAGFEFVGKAHNALDDARNTAELLHVVRDKKLFNKTLRKIKECMDHSSISCSLGEMFDMSAFVCA